MKERKVDVVDILRQAAREQGLTGLEGEHRAAPVSPADASMHPPGRIASVRGKFELELQPSPKEA